MDRAAARRVRLTKRLVALITAGATHVAVLGLLAQGLETEPVRRPEADVGTRLASLYAFAPGPEGARSKPRREARLRPSAQTTISPELPTAPHAAAAPAIPDSRPQAATSGEADRLRAALRSLAGCDDADSLGLTDAEHERCRQRLDQATRQAPVLPVGPADPKKRARLDHEIRVDEAFRAYRRSSSPDDYPGLRTFIPALRPLFGDEPREPGPN